MKELNIPSYNALIPREHRIRALQDIYQYLSDQSKEITDFMDTYDATFKGTFDDLSALGNISADINDYSWLTSKDDSGNTVYKHYRYVKDKGWTYEYSLTNPVFSSTEWAAIQSTITKELVDKLSSIPSSFAAVATSGDYADLLNKPSIPSKVSELTNDNGYLTEHQSLADYIKSSSLATVATSGSYNDLSDKPTIPVIPTNVSAFNNDAGYLTQHQSLAEYSKTTDIENTYAKKSEIPSLEGYAKTSAIPTKVSQLENDAKYLTTHQDISGKVDKVSGKGLSTNDYTTAEKTKLQGIEEGANKTIIDNELSDSSENPLQNKVVDAAIKDNKAIAAIVALSSRFGYNVDNPEYVFVILDKDEKVLFGIKEDATVYQPISTAELLTFVASNMPATSGTLANAPALPYIGQQYFCTDKQTTEGATNGIMIYYNGTSWVDALGRTIS